MLSVKSLALIYAALAFWAPLAEAVQHLRLTPDNKRIVAVTDTTTALKNGGSLIDFIRQGELAQQAVELSHKMDKKLDAIRSRQLQDDPDIDEKLRTEMGECRMGRSTRLHSDSCITDRSPFYFDAVLKGHKEVLANVPEYSLYNSMRCDDIVKMPHSMYMMDHLPSMDIRHHEKPQVRHIEFGGSTLVQLFSEMMSAARQLIWMTSKGELNSDANPLTVTHVLLRLGELHRRVGDYPASLQCHRIALDTVADVLSMKEPSEMLLMPLVYLSLGNLLRTMKQFDDAAMVHAVARNYELHVMRQIHHQGTQIGAEIFDLVGVLTTLINLGEAESLLAIGNFTQAIEAYDDTEQYLVLEPLKRPIPQLIKSALEEVPARKAAMRCDLRMREVLEGQESNMMGLIEDKLEYNEMYEEHREIGQAMYSKMLSPAEVKQSELVYDYVKYGANSHARCQVRTDATTGRRQLLRTVCERNAQGEEKMRQTSKDTEKLRRKANRTRWRQADVYGGDRAYAYRLQSYEGATMDEPQMQARYPLGRKQWESVKDRFWRRADWPAARDCQAAISREDLFHPQHYPHAWISPENKGFIVSDLLTKMIALEAGAEHPLPWKEPLCGEDGFDVRHDQMSGVEAVVDAWVAGAGRHAKWAEPEMRGIFIRLAERRLHVGDVAQRIRTLLERNIGPRWLAYNLAALYWRVAGSPKEAITCLCKAIGEAEGLPYTELALVQLSQVVWRVTGDVDHSHRLLQMALGGGSVEPTLHYLFARHALLVGNVDGAIAHLKDAMDRDPFDARIGEDLLRLTCSGQSSKSAIRDLYPTVCCSAVVQHAVCFKSLPGVPGERCFVFDPESGLDKPRLIYNRCNGVYTGDSYPTHDYINVVSPFLPIYATVPRKDGIDFFDDAGGLQGVESDELPLDYGGSDAFFSARPAEWWTRTKKELKYDAPAEKAVDDWVETVEYKQPVVPEKPLSFLWIKEKREMLKYDVRLPDLLPRPQVLQVRRGLVVFPPPRVSTAMCNGVPKISSLLETQISTFVSVTAKGEDIDKYVDKNSPMPSLAGLEPECPTDSATVEGKGAGNWTSTGHSPILAMDHLPYFPLSDQFLYYKPEKALTDALKSNVGNQRDQLEHIAARLSHAMKVSRLRPEMSEGQADGVHWLLSLVTSLYWRVRGDGQRAVICLRHALSNAPPHMRDVALVSLANVCHQAGMLHSAVVVAGQALAHSPDLVAVHFTIANIYASMGQYQLALEFYYSSISLQERLETVKERIRAIYCHSGETFDF